MALENRFRFNELVTQGSKAIVSEDPTTKNHTFVDGSSIIVSASQDVPYEHKQGERDGEVTAFIEKPAYTEEELIKAVDVNIDELVKPPKDPRPDVVPRPVYDELENKFQQALLDLEAAQQRILSLEGEVAQLTAQLQATLVENDSLKTQKAVVDNQFQQSTERYKEQTSKLGTAIIKATKEANERVRLNAQVEGLVAQKDVLRQQLLSLRKIVSGLEGQVEAGVDALRAQTEAAKAQREAQAAAAEAQRTALENQQQQLESQLAGTAAETAAAAAGLVPLDDGESYYGVKSDADGGGSDVKWTTSVDNPKPGKAGMLTVQNLKDSGAKITNISISVQGSIKDWSKPILGFGSDGSPSTSSTVSINKGSKTQIPLYFNKGIGGRNKPEPDRSNLFNSNKDYRGNFTITARYDDGTSTKSSSLSWAIRKNKQ